MNLTKLAKMANVSVSTVSKAFADSKEISAETKEEIFKIAKETGCFEKYFKPKYSKKLIAIICPELQGVHYSQMVTQIEKSVRECGDTIIISFSNFSSENQKELIDYFAKYARVDGIIVIEPVGRIESADIPIVQISLTDEPSDVNTINVDIRSAMDRAVKRLKLFGHGDVGFIGEKNTRVEYGYFEEFMLNNGLEIKPEFVSVNDGRFYDCGSIGVDEIFAGESRPTAVFAAYSHVAAGVLQRLEELGVKVPDEMSVICMDDINTTPYMPKKLACVKMHIDELCYQAVRLLYQCFDARFGTAKHTVTVKREFSQGETLCDLTKTGGYENEKN